MKTRVKSGGLLMLLLMFMQWAFAGPFVREASFQRIFNGEDFFEPGKDLSIKLSTMSGIGNIVAFYGTGSFDGSEPHLFIHNFDSPVEPEGSGGPREVTLPDKVGIFRTNTGLISNKLGSRFFFVADDASDTIYGDFLFCMLDTTTNQVTVLLDARPSHIEVPQDIATDAEGKYLYFNETDNGDQGDLWRIGVTGNATPELVIQAGAVDHPSGGVGRFIDEFDVSDYGTVIAFFIEGRIESSDSIRYDKELFVKIGGAEPMHLTNDDNEGHASAKKHLRLSGDGTTIVYSDKNSELMVTKTSADSGAQKRIEPGYVSFCNKPGITTDGSVIFTLLNPEKVSAPSGYLIRSDGTGRLKMDTESSYAGIEVEGCTAEGVHMSGDGNRVFFKTRVRVDALGEYVSSLYTGIFNFSPWTWLPNPPWATEVPMVTGIKYPAPLAFGITNPEDFPPFKVKLWVGDEQGPTDLKVERHLLRFDGYADYGDGPITVNQPKQISTGIWESDGAPEDNWPTPVDPKDYDPLEPETARFSVKDLDGNLAYRDIILQAAEGGCSGTGPQELNPDDLAEGKDVSCITDGLIETRGEVTVRDGVVLYLSGYGVYLNGGSTDSFKVQAGAGLIIR